jgi:hypothetical protein
MCRPSGGPVTASRGWPSGRTAQGDEPLGETMWLPRCVVNGAGMHPVASRHARGSVETRISWRDGPWRARAADAGGHAPIRVMTAGRRQLDSEPVALRFSWHGEET